LFRFVAALPTIFFTSVSNSNSLNSTCSYCFCLIRFLSCSNLSCEELTSISLCFPISSHIIQHNVSLSTAKRIVLERRGIQTSSSFVKIWLVCIPESKANLLFFWHLYGLVFYLESIGVRYIMIWWLAFEKKPFQFWREIWIQVVVILLQLYPL
jgi:hypothetical protein